jgi:ADP-dependent NAD(P)H-hydrate dehydratase
MAQKKRSERSKVSPSGSPKSGGKSGKRAGDTPVAPVALTTVSLASMPLGTATGSEASLLIVGGTAFDAGALVLAGTAAVRGGAAQLEVATARPIVALVTAMLPQARGLGLDSRRSGTISAASSRRVAERARRVRVLLVGPGMRDGREAERFLGRVVARLDPKNAPTLVLDGDVLGILARFPDLLRRLDGRAILVARRSQLVTLTKSFSGARDKGGAEQDALALARAAAREWKALVVSADSDGGGFVVAPGGRAATVAGTLAAPSRLPGAAAGLIAAFAARGAEPFAAASWGLLVRSRAMARVTETIGHQGFLGSELLAEVPRELEALAEG